MKKRCKHKWKTVKFAGASRKKCVKCDMIRAQDPKLTSEQEKTLISVSDEAWEKIKEESDRPTKCETCGQEHAGGGGLPYNCIVALRKRIERLEASVRDLHRTTMPIRRMGGVSYR